MPHRRIGAAAAVSLAVSVTLVSAPATADPGPRPSAPQAPSWAPPAKAPTAPPWTPHRAGSKHGETRDDAVADLPLDDAGNAIVTRREERLLAPGLELTEFARLSADGWLSGEVLVADLGPVGDLSPGQVGVGYLGADRIADSTSVSDMANASGAVAAINGDYFDINNSDAPLGVAVDGGRLLKSPTPGRSRSVAIGPDGAGRLAQLFLEGSVAWSADGTDHDLPVAGLNVTSLPAGGVAVYDAAWGDYTRTRALGAGETGVEVTVAADGAVLAVGEPRAGQLPDGVRAIVARPGAAADALATLTPGDTVEVAYGLREDAGDVSVAIGGGVEDWLLEDGEVTSGSGSHVELRHPRTAVGFSEDGRTAYFVVVDGRQTRSIGMNLYELGELMAQVGADDAINLDGGGSSDMVARIPGDETVSVINNPSDGYERPVPNGLGLFAPEGSGRVAGYDLRTAVPADDADRVFPGLHRTLVAEGYDETRDAVDTAPTTWRTAAPSTARVSGDGATAVLEGRSSGTTRVTAASGPSRGAASGSLDVEVLGELVRTSVGSPVVTLADDQSTATLVLTGHDARGFTAPVEARDITVTGGSDADGEPLAALEPAADGSFTVRALQPSGATSFRLAVGSGADAIVTEVAVAVGLDQVSVADFSDAAQWTSAHDRAPGGSVGPASGYDGAPGLRLTYDFTQSTATRGQYAVAPGGARQVPGQPRMVTAWVNGDGNGSWLRLQVRQGNGVTTQLDGPFVDWTGWRLAEFAVPSGVEFPLTLQRFRVLETRPAAQYTGEIVVSDLRAHVPPDVTVPDVPRVEDPVVTTYGGTEGSPLRIAVMSDAQFVARSPESPAVEGARQTLREIVAADPDLLVINGDFVDEASPADFDLARRILTEELGEPGTEPFPWYYVPGNHEIMGGSIANFEAEFGERTRVVDVPARDGHGLTRLVMLDTSTGRLNHDFAQVQMLRNALDGAAQDDRISGVVVFGHHPLDDPLPTKASQLSDRLEADLLRGWYEEFRESTGKPIASVGAHVGVFHADTQDGVPYLVNGNSGKSPSSTPANGGFTGWSMLGLDPADARERDWLAWEVRTRAESVTVDGPGRLSTGQAGDVSAVAVQDGTREVPVAWPVSSRWGGEDVCVTTLDGERDLLDARRHCGGRDVLAVDPSSGTTLALRPGDAELTVTVNGVHGSLDVAVSSRQ